MQRRQFLTAASAAAVALTLPKSGRAARSDSAASSGRQFIDLRVYHFKSADKQQAYAKFLADTGVAAYNRAGVQTAGLFHLAAADNPKLKLQDDPADLWLLLPHESIESFLVFESRLAADGEYQQAGREILSAGKSDPAFARYDSHLLLSFEGHPKLTAPADKPEGRLYELRTYESPNQERAASKIAMFNNGEIPLFSKAGMPPVFYGSALAGADLPHLTYMIYHGTEDPKKHWSAFGSNPDWKTMQADPQYKDNVSTIHNWFLRPLPGSQL
jgi:hypothetical protein